MFIGVPISGPIASSAINRPKNDASLKGIVVRKFKRLPETAPSPAIPVVPVPEDEVRPRSFSAVESNVVNDDDDVDVVTGDARLCSDEVIELSSCDSADCTPVPVAVPVACATAAD
jgi:hypothetical protein